MILDADLRRCAALRSALALLAAALCLGGCNGSDVPFGRAVRCAVPGIDVSRHQGVIAWPRVRAAGFRFVWIKATEGGDYTDPAFRRNWMLAEAAGLRRGAYHFVYWCRPAPDQAAWFIANVPDDPAALPPVLDVEWNPASRTCPGKVTREVAMGMMQVILSAMEKTYGRRPIIYAPLDFYQDVLEGSLEDYPLWIRSVGTAPGDGYGHRGWLVRQQDDNGTVAGIHGPVDEDCFDGDTGQWTRLAAAWP